MVGPNSDGSVVTIKPNSGAADLAQIKAPLEIKRSVKTLLKFCLVFFKYLLPCIIGYPANDESISFKSIGTPAKGPLFKLISLIDFLAKSYISVVMKFSFELFFDKLSIAVSNTSSIDTSFSLISSAKPIPS